MYVNTRVKVLLSCAIVLLSFNVALCAAESVSDGEHILIYDDGSLSPLAAAVKKELSGDFKKRKIKWTVKSKKGGLLAEINKNLEKDVIKKKSNIVILAFGIHDACDAKKGTIKEYDAEALRTALNTAIASLKESGVRIILATPGLAGENLEDEHQAAIDAISDLIKECAEAHGLSVCDIRNKATSWLKSNPPAKKKKYQLSKKGGKWSKTGEEIMSPSLMSAIGMSKSGIKRAIRWDERIVMATNLAVWTTKIEDELEPKLRAAGPQAAPKGFFNPSVKGPDWVHCTVKDLDSGPFEFDRVKTQKPTVLTVYVLHRLVGILKYDVSKYTANLDGMMKDLSTYEVPTFVFTPLWADEDGGAIVEGGKRHERCKILAQMIRDAAAKHGVAVVDLFAMCEKEYAANKKASFFEMNAKKQLMMTPAGKNIIMRETLRILGVASEE